MGRRTALAVAVGGAAGASLRWALVEATGDATDWPWAVFVANIAGSFVLGLLVAAFPWSRQSTPAFAGAATGFCGALTTFSAFAVDLAVFLRDDRLSLAIAYLSASVVVGVAAYLTGRRIAGAAS